MPIRQQRHVENVILWFFIGFCCLIALASSLPIWPEIPHLRVRLSGIQTQATAHIVEQCDMVTDAGDPLFIYQYTFTGTNGEHYTITRENVCSNAFKENASLPIWYLAGDPEHFLTDDELAPSSSTLTTFGTIALASLGGAIGLLVFLAFKALRRSRQSHGQEALS